MSVFGRNQGAQSFGSSARNQIDDGHLGQNIVLAMRMVLLLTDGDVPAFWTHRNGQDALHTGCLRQDANAIPHYVVPHDVASRDVNHVFVGSHQSLLASLHFGDAQPTEDGGSDGVGHG